MPVSPYSGAYKAVGMKVLDNGLFVPYMFLFGAQGWMAPYTAHGSR